MAATSCVVRKSKVTYDTLLQVGAPNVDLWQPVLSVANCAEITLQ